MAKANTLLSDTDLPLKEIASRLGYGDQRAFSMVFHRATGEAPRTYRQQFSRRAVLAVHGGTDGE